MGLHGVGCAPNRLKTPAVFLKCKRPNFMIIGLKAHPFIEQSRESSTMEVKECMGAQVVTVTLNDTVAHAVKQMAQNDFGSLLVENGIRLPQTPVQASSTIKGSAVANMRSARSSEA